MNKKDYSKISTSKKSTKSKKTEKVEEPKEIVEEIKEVVEEVPEIVEVKEGIVNCNKLNVRIEPKKDSTVIAIISDGESVKVLDDSDKEFYKVIISNGSEGYCMKKFIDIK